MLWVSHVRHVTQKVKKTCQLKREKGLKPHGYSLHNYTVVMNQMLILYIFVNSPVGFQYMIYFIQNAGSQDGRKSVLQLHSTVGGFIRLLW